MPMDRERMPNNHPPTNLQTFKSYKLQHISTRMNPLLGIDPNSVILLNYIHSMKLTLNVNKILLPSSSPTPLTILQGHLIFEPTSNIMHNLGGQTSHIMCLLDATNYAI